MQNQIVYKICRILAVCLSCVLLAGIARAETFHLANGQTLTGDVVSVTDEGVVLKQADGSYGERTPWTKFSQADLKEMEQNPKFAQFVEPYIEPSPDEKLKRTEITVKDVDRLNRPPKGSFTAAMFTSTLGIFVILVLYAGNLFAAYEISIFRAQSVGLVCGVSAVAPVIGPIIFLSIPTKLPQHKEDPTWGPPPEAMVEPGLETAIAADQAAEQAAAAAHPPAPNLPPTKTFARGQFTFNRRFFETQLAAFFPIARPEAEKDKVLTVKAARGTYIAQRITRVTANDITVHVQTGPASEDVVIPFVEVQEVQLKHKDA